MRAYVLSKKPLPLPINTAVTARAALPEAATLDAAIELSRWYFPEAETRRAEFEHGLLLETAEPGVKGALLLTASVAAVLATSPAGVVVLFATGPVLHEREAFLEQAADASEDDLPMFLWTAFELVEHEDGTRSLFTQGATAIGAPMEIEVDHSRRSAEELLERASDALLVALTAGAEVSDGDTIELSEDVVRVRIQPSLKNSGERTWRLRIP